MDEFNRIKKSVVVDKGNKGIKYKDRAIMSFENMEDVAKALKEIKYCK